MANKTERVGLVVSPEERLSLSLLAEVDGLSEAAVIRRLIRHEARRLGIWQDIILGKYEDGKNTEEMAGALEADTPTGPE